MTSTLPQTPKIDFENLTLCDALDLAVLIEEEARDRYEELTTQLSIHHTLAAAMFFSKMVRIEEMHRQALAERRQQEFGDQPRRVTREMIFDVEAPDYDDVRTNMTRRRALEIALAAETKAEQFFANTLKFVTHPEVRLLFEELRTEEQEHQAMVKKEIARLPPDPAVPDDAFIDDPAAID